MHNIGPKMGPKSRYLQRRHDLGSTGRHKTKDGAQAPLTWTSSRTSSVRVSPSPCRTPALYARRRWPRCTFLVNADVQEADHVPPNRSSLPRSRALGRRLHGIKISRAIEWDGDGWKTLPDEFGEANSIMSFGKTSGTPPTLVLTMNYPAEAASMMLIPKASVSEVHR
jgi:hypothetical protein